MSSIVNIYANSALSKQFKNLLQNLTLHSEILKTSFTTASDSTCKSKNKKTYNVPQPPKDPPDNYNPECVNHKAFEAPDYLPAAIFRPFSSDDEVLGPGANKNCDYKNCEYYAYHRYSFIALQMATLAIRNKMKKKDDDVRCLYKNEGDDIEDKCDGDSE